MTGVNPADPDPLEGSPYRTRGVLGEGAMGVVLEVEHRKLKTVLCVKLIRPRVLAEAVNDDSTRREHLRQLLDRMRLEAEALAVLEGHPNLLQIRDFGETTSGFPYLVTERLYGRTLKEELGARYPLTVAEAVDFACQALDGLALAHDKGIVHRDLKPANLFVCKGPDGRRLVKVLDFGIAKVVGGGASADAPAPLAVPTAQGFALGTPRYFSPEQAMAKPVGPASDVYAMGCVVFELLTGLSPFHAAKNQLDIALAHVNEDPPTVASMRGEPVGAALEAAVKKALAKEPADRFPSAREMAAALRAAVGPKATVRMKDAPARVVARELVPAPEPVAAPLPAGMPRPGKIVTDLLERPEAGIPAPLRARAVPRTLPDAAPAMPASRPPMPLPIPATPPAESSPPWKYFLLILALTMLAVVLGGYAIVRLSGAG